ncbi:hypothetical protein [Vagococcus fluvialis]|uniref:DUF1189 domain-containing protein n=2 Tax=Vagococcus fluvialis TaxID=2738 RepID=A0A369AMF6_9ENTE|nr:hypothetical protein [Vagococcus fluvialis]MDT2746906.1 hypothetical protein [Vagococcus fluvialis]RCX10572.1 hypothetical protein DFR54_11631 [Vagococcus fluvialis]RST99417.1 hypothetical protein CBF32_11780 [Vagococcus fluvialis]UDM74568.1 hypothetical protein K5K99_02870 [Vagococcus fluvialis]
MDFLMSMILFDKSALIKKEEQKKRYSYLFVIALILITSLVVVIAKTVAFNEDVLRNNFQQIDSLKKDQIVYQDGLNRVKIEKASIMLNGDNLFSIDNLKNNEEVLDALDDMTGGVIQLSFMLFIYQYLSSFKYLLLFLIILGLLSFTSQKQIKLVEDVSLRLTTTYTSYILMIPILLSLVIRFLNIRFSFAVLILTTISIVLEYLFVNYYMKEKGIADEEKMVA